MEVGECPGLIRAGGEDAADAQRGRSDEVMFEVAHHLRPDGIVDMKDYLEGFALGKLWGPL
jgi:hypothetical protein